MRRIEVKQETEYGDLRTIREVPLAYKSTSPITRKRVFLCRCSCGREVLVRLDHLRSGHTQSCGQCGLEHNGQRKTLKAWAASIGIAESTLRARLKIMGLGEALARLSWRSQRSNKFRVGSRTNARPGCSQASS